VYCLAWLVDFAGEEHGLTQEFKWLYLGARFAYARHEVG